MKINDFFSPNYDKSIRSKKSIKLIVIHYTGMQSERVSLVRLCNSKSKVSSHFLINRNGKIYRLVKTNRVAWHAGYSCWGKFKNLNKNSIGIELVNKGHEFGYSNFKRKQLISLLKLCKKLIRKYNIKKNNVVGHSDIAPNRKTDPGEKFPWEKLAANKIGIWHSCNTKILTKKRNKKVYDIKEKIKFIKNLNKIGYCFKEKKGYNFKKTLIAFQRHFRKKLVNGVLDRECLIISENIAKKL